MTPMEVCQGCGGKLATREKIVRVTRRAERARQSQKTKAPRDRANLGLFPLTSCWLWAVNLGSPRYGAGIEEPFEPGLHVIA